LSNSKNTEPLLVLFDGKCMLCNRSVQWLLSIDKQEKLTFATLDYALSNHLVKAPQTLPDSIIFLRNKTILVRSNALIAILIEVGGWYQAAILLKIIPSFLRDAIYDVIAKYRYKVWGKTEACLLLTPALKHRFLDA